MRISMPENSSGDASPLEAATNYTPDIAAAGNAFAYAVYQHSNLPLRVFEAARIATAVINGCLVCKNWRVARDIAGLGIDGGVINNGVAPDEAFYRQLLSEDTEGLDPREKLAVRFARAMGTKPQELSGDDEFWDEFKAVFSDAEITELSYCIAAWMGMGRVAHVLGLDVACVVNESPEAAA